MLLNYIHGTTCPKIFTHERKEIDACFPSSNGKGKQAKEATNQRLW